MFTTFGWFIKALIEFWTTGVPFIPELFIPGTIVDCLFDIDGLGVNFNKAAYKADCVYILKIIILLIILTYKS